MKHHNVTRKLTPHLTPAQLADALAWLDSLKASH